MKLRVEVEIPEHMNTYELESILINVAYMFHGFGLRKLTSGESGIITNGSKDQDRVENRGRWAITDR